MTMARRLHLVLTRLQTLEMLWLRRSVCDGICPSHISRCARDHAHTCIGSLRHLRVSTPALPLLRSPILKPYLHLSVRQSYGASKFGFALNCDILIEQKFLFQFDFLLLCVHDAVLVFGARLTCTRQTFLR